MLELPDGPSRPGRPKDEAKKLFFLPDTRAVATTWSSSPWNLLAGSGLELESLTESNITRKTWGWGTGLRSPFGKGVLSLALRGPQIQCSFSSLP